MATSPTTPNSLSTPKFDPAVHESPSQNVHSGSEWKDPNWQPAPLPGNGPGTMDLPRIEDSLEAIDDLEDALEEIGQALPTVEDHDGLDSPVRGESPTEERSLADHQQETVETKNTTNGSAGKGAARKGQQPNAQRNQPLHDTTKAKPQRLSTALRPEASSKPRSPGSSKPQPTTSRTSSNVTGRQAQSAVDRKSSHPSVSTPKTNNAQSRKIDVSSLSTSKPAFVPAKSSKPPTRSTFELPGEAISRRLRAQREERIRKEEEELKKRREFKAGRIRYSMAPTTAVRETATSRLRANRLSEISQSAENDPQNNRPSFRITSETPSRRISSVNKPTSGGAVFDERVGRRMSSISSATRQSTVSSSPMSRSQSVRGPSSGPAANSKARDLSATSRRSSTALTQADVIAQKARGKEVFGRDRQQVEQRVLDRRQREEAAKKARAEAAERGRRTSRLWAERQQQKTKTADQKAGDLPNSKPEQGPKVGT